MNRFVAVLILLLTLTGCRSAAPPLAGERLWRAIEPLCGRTFEGRMVEGTDPADAAFGAQRLVMHVQSCTADEIRIPFDVGDDRSRTWVLTRTGDGLRLKHDHRHADGTPDEITQYGGDAAGDLSRLSVDFPADAYTATLLPRSATNIWTIGIEPARTFTYALRREAEGRRFRVEFDLTRETSRQGAGGETTR